MAKAITPESLLELSHMTVPPHFYREALHGAAVEMMRLRAALQTILDAEALGKNAASLGDIARAALSAARQPEGGGA